MRQIQSSSSWVAPIGTVGVRGRPPSLPYAAARFLRSSLLLLSRDAIMDLRPHNARSHGGVSSPLELFKVHHTPPCASSWCDPSADAMEIIKVDIEKLFSSPTLLLVALCLNLRRVLHSLSEIATLHTRLEQEPLEVPFDISSVPMETKSQPLAEKKAAVADIQPDQHHLVFTGKQLNDVRILADHSIHKKSTLHFTLSLLAGDKGSCYPPKMEPSLLTPALIFRQHMEPSLLTPALIFRQHRLVRRKYVLVLLFLPWKNC